MCLLDVNQKSAKVTKFFLEIFGGMRKTLYLCTRQKVNRLFRLVVIDLGF